MQSKLSSRLPEHQLSKAEVAKAMMEAEKDRRPARQKLAPLKLTQFSSEKLANFK